MNAEQTRDVLAALAKNRTASDIADYLANYKGKPGDPETCPIARYILANVDDAETVLVGNWTVAVRDSRGVGGGGIVLPMVVSQFIQEFDRGAYPELRQV